jgi:hypothetical protein
VFHRVLDERLQQERRHQRFDRRRIGLNGEVQPIAEADLLDLEIVAHHIELATERNNGLVESIEDGVQ